MRVDASNLLNRLGRQDFSYKEFEDRFSDLELWPMLEALLKDPRLLELESGTAASTPESQANEVTPQLRQAEPAAAPAVAANTPSADAIGALFRRYDTPDTPAETPAPSSTGQDVRAMLRHLSELGSRGEI